MEIFIYNNDQSDKIQLPVIPESIEVSSNQSIETFKTMGQGNLKLIGELESREFSLECFFPANFYPFIHGWDMRDAMEYVETINDWRDQRKPIYAYISDLNIAGRFIISSMSYQIKDGSGDVYYKMKFEEYISKRQPPTIDGILIKTSNLSTVTVAKDGYSNNNSLIAGNMRTGAGTDYGFANVSLSEQKIRKYRQVGAYVQTNKGFILKKYLEVKKSGS